MIVNIIIKNQNPNLNLILKLKLMAKMIIVNQKEILFYKKEQIEIFMFHLSI